MKVKKLLLFLAFLPLSTVCVKGEINGSYKKMPAQ